MRTILALLTASLFLAAMPVVAAADNQADCEDDVTWQHDHDPEPNSWNNHTHTSDQPWIGYTSSAGAQAIVDGFFPGTVRTCEGEHWDGQDEVSSNSGGNSLGAGCIAQSSEGDDVAVCMTPTETKDGQGTAPVGARVSNDGVRHYVGVNLPVGYATLFVDENGVVAIYLRDNTPGNPLAQAVSAAGITKGFPSEGDCTQGEYQTGAMNNDRNACGRDNTAITVTLFP